jgi:hypothetical protein
MNIHETIKLTRVPYENTMISERIYEGKSKK